MVLVRCYKCGQQVSSQVSTCPKCGTRVDLGEPESATATRLRRLLLPGGILVLGVVAVFLWRAASSRVAQNREAAATRSAEGIQRARDSARVIELLALPLTNERALEADDLVHREGMEILHATVHELAADVRLDSAGRLLETPDYQSTRLAAGRAVMASITAPLLPRQEARRSLLLRLVNDKTVLATQPDPATMRAKFGTLLEAEFRQSRIEGKVSTQGPGGTTLHLIWRLVSRELASQRGTDVVLGARLRALGFVRFEISDGYDRTWTWDLRP